MKQPDRISQGASDHETGTEKRQASSRKSRHCLLAATLAVAPAAAQQVTGALGSPSATITIRRQAAPAAADEVRRRDQGKRHGFQAVVAAARRAAQGRAQRAAHHDRRPGLWRFGHLRRRHPDARAGPHRQGGLALHAVPLHRALLADAGGADHRPQPPLGGLRRDRRIVHGLPGLRLRHRPGERHASARSSGTTAMPRRGSARTTTRRPSSTARPGPSTNGRRGWASSISTASWAARPTSGRPTCSAITPRSSRGSASPATTSPPTGGRGDQAHARSERGRARPAVLRLLRARRHPLAAPAEEGMDREVQRQVRHGL